MNNILCNYYDDNYGRLGELTGNFVDANNSIQINKLNLLKFFSKFNLI